MTPHDDAHWGEGRYMSHAAAERKIAQARAEGRIDWQFAVSIALFVGLIAGVILGEMTRP